MSIYNEKVYYGLPNRNPKYFLLKQAGETLPDASYYIERDDKSTTNVLEYILDGKGYIEIDGVTTPVGKGDCTIIPSKTAHKYYADQDNPYTKIWVNVSGDFVDNLIKEYFPNNKSIVSNINNEKPLRNVLEALINGDKEQEKICFLAVTEFIINLENNANNLENNLVDENAIKEYIKNNITCPFSLEKLSKYFYLSISQINRIFKKSFDTTPYNYYNHARLEMAKKLLLNHSLDIDEIAYKLHFTDRAHFANSFVKEYGVTPAFCRENITIDKLKYSDIDKASMLFAKAFYNYPLYQYFFPNEENRLNQSFYFFKFELLNNINDSYVLQKNNEIIAVAIYKSPISKAPIAPAIFKKIKFAYTILVNVQFDSLIKGIKYKKFCDKCAKKHLQPTDNYLHLIAVSEQIKGKGIAKNILTILCQNESVFLETQDPKNVEIYKKLGFVCVETYNFNQLNHFLMRKL